MRLVGLFVALLSAGALAGTASAATPVRMPFDITGIPATLSGVCSFDVSVLSNEQGTTIVWFDANGVPTHVVQPTTEQDTFSANGKTVTGLPYTFELNVLFDASGNPTHIYSSGEVERIVLPDGTLFLSAGRTDFINHPGGFVISPDEGHPGDVAALCAALS